MSDRDFETKTFSTILDDLHLELEAQQSFLPPGKPKLTDFKNPGSIIYTITRSIAATLSLYWQQLEELTNTFYIQSSSGERLKKRLKEFGFETRFGSKAQGTIQVVRPTSSNFTGSITTGTTLFYGRLQFVVTTGSVSFPPQSGIKAVVSVQVEAVLNGVEYNLPVNSQLIPADSSYNTLEFRVGTQMDNNFTNAITGGLSNGVDDETDEEARLRFQTYIQNLGKGTLDIIKSSVNGVSGVRNCKIYDNSRVINGAIDGPETNNNSRNYPGYIVVQVQPADSNSGLSETLVAQVKKAVESSKAAGVAYQIHSVPVLEIDLEITVKTTLSSGSSDWNAYIAELTILVEEKINSLDLKESLYIWVLQSDLINYDKFKAPGGITVTVKNTAGVSIGLDGKVTPTQLGDGGVISLRNITFTAQSL